MVRPKITAGVLSLQGDYAAHAKMLTELGAAPLEVRSAAELRRVDVLVMPGGESTTMSLLLDRSGLRRPLIERISGGLPVLATCAGLILCANRLEGDTGSVRVKPLELIDITADRNAYGRQVNSFEAHLRVDWPQLGLGGERGTLPAIFIRAPRIIEYGPKVKPVAWHGGKVVAARQRNILVAAFHPELRADPRFHQALLGFAKC